jgi:hypothetical protein
LGRRSRSSRRRSNWIWSSASHLDYTPEIKWLHMGSNRLHVD